MMIRANSFSVVGVLCMVVSLLLGAGCDSAARDVAATDDAYDKALNSNDGAAAVEYLSKDSLAWMDEMLEKARKAQKAEVMALPFNERYEVLRMRLILKPEEIKGATGKTYYAQAVNRGWVTSTSEARRTKITVTGGGKRAIVVYKYPGERENFRGSWVLEDGRWKEDLVTEASEVNNNARVEAGRQRITEHQYLMQLLEYDADGDIPETVWNPPR